jgi:microcystin-dependent protein
MDEFVGIIKLFAGSFAPQGWAFCHGQLLSVRQNQVLFTIIGTTYGGDGANNFALPDLRSRVPVGAGKGEGLANNYPLGSKSGTESNLISQDNIPALQGNINLSNLNGSATGVLSTSVNAEIKVPCSEANGLSSPVDKVFGIDSNSFSTPYASNAEDGKFMKPFTANIPINLNANLPVTLNGGSATVTVNKDSTNPKVLNNIQPSLGLNYIICIQGSYPQRD